MLSPHQIMGTLEHGNMGTWEHGNIFYLNYKSQASNNKQYLIFKT